MITINKYHVCGQRILVEPIATEAETPGGIVIPESARSQTYKGRVVKSEFDDYHPEDVVYYKPYTASSPILIDGQELLVLNIDDILLVEHNHEDKY